MIIRPENIKIADFTYNLPDARIAKYPLTKRDQSKLLIYKNGQISEAVFSNIPKMLPQLSVLVRNNTKVIQARIEFLKSTGGRIEVFCLEPADPPDYESNLSSSNSVSWYCLIGNAKKWKTGSLSKIIHLGSEQISLNATRVEPHDGKEVVRFSWHPQKYSFSEILDHIGTTPIPPYLQRKAEPDDKSRYQTLYAIADGSVAAPTAGLHFTPKTELELKNRRIRISEITLHVGAGTFTPVKSESIDQHQMHTEHIRINRDTIHDLLSNEPLGITAVGTTSMRTLESLYWLGYLLSSGKAMLSNEIHINQWLPYKSNQAIPVRTILTEILKQMDANKLEFIDFSTSLFIIPGYSFKLVDRLITNFHQPGSTLLLLVAAFIGDDWKKIYEYALNNDFRFLSYGDSCLFISNTRD
ncbi:MAG: S-adenosylmethionine:tRNA ribosyltransferase-isomerase [Bacteroidales bacterium]|nr:S-adenosylmethionine:tRNA ribosyltransferase-isomerase [Bacteroidales bacterium]